jgi:hypothetical protein
MNNAYDINRRANQERPVLNSVQISNAEIQNGFPYSYFFSNQEPSLSSIWYQAWCFQLLERIKFIMDIVWQLLEIDLFLVLESDFHFTLSYPMLYLAKGDASLDYSFFEMVYSLPRKSASCYNFEGLMKLIFINNSMIKAL